MALLFAYRTITSRRYDKEAAGNNDEKKKVGFDKIISLFYSKNNFTSLCFQM